MTHTFIVNKKFIEVFFAEDGAIEIYERENPRYTGFILDNVKDLNLFINNLTDIAERY